MIGKVDWGLVHVKNLAKVLMRTDEERMGLLEEGLCLLSHLGESAS